MQLLLYILLFTSGGLCVYLFQRNRLNEWKKAKNSTPETLSDTANIIEPKEEKQANYEELTQLKKNTENLYLVNELGQRVTSSLNLQQTFQHLYNTINSMMDAAVMELTVAGEITGVRKTFSNVTLPETYTNHMSDWCFTNNREIFLADAENDYGRYVFQPLVLPDGRMAKSVIAFPVINRNTVTGTLCIISFQKNTFSDYHREIIRLLLGYISVAIENAIRHEELNLTKIRAEQSEKFKEQFLANMSHEIRTPINAVTGMTGLLLEKQPRPDQLKYLESIRNASDSLLVIINDILDLSKIEAGKIEFEKIDFSVSDLVKNVREIMNFKIEEKGLSFTENIDPDIPQVLTGDPTRLTQVLINLLGNAIKFTEKGAVSLRVGTDKANITSPTHNGSEDRKIILRFDVKDTGIGMTKSQQSRLFQNYAQASPETSRKYGGTGLGLSISKQLVNLQGGEIEVSSEINKGSTFSFTLPFTVSKNKTVIVKENTVSKEMIKSLGNIRVLLCDDNEYNRIVVKETLQLKIENSFIEEATDGTRALELLKKNDYDVVLMDLVMPGLDGLEAARIIRNEFPEPKNKIPIIALSASVVKSEMEKSYSAGMNGFIPKPFKSHQLIGAIYKALNNIKSDGFEESNQTKPAPDKNELIDLNYMIGFFDGDRVRMQSHIKLFIDKMPEYIQTLISALSKKDYEQIRITAHSMKPQLHFTGVLGGLAIAEEIEKNCTTKNSLNDLPELIDKLRIICEQAFTGLSEMNIKGNSPI